MTKFSLIADESIHFNGFFKDTGIRQAHWPMVRATVTAQNAVAQNVKKKPYESAINPAMNGRAAMPRYVVVENRPIAMP